MRVKTYEDTLREERMPRRTSTSSTTPTKMKCFNCDKPGHKSIHCPEPQKKPRCKVCNKIGHDEKDCRSKRTDKDDKGGDRRVKRIQRESCLPNEYHERISLDGKQLVAFVDLGSGVVTLREDVARNNDIKFIPCRKNLRGFGNGLCQTTGKRTSIIEIDDVELETEVRIVPEESQEKEVILGRSAVDQPGIKVTKTENNRMRGRTCKSRPRSNDRKR